MRKLNHLKSLYESLRLLSLNLPESTAEAGAQQGPARPRQPKGKHSAITPDGRKEGRKETPSQKKAKPAGKEKHEARRRTEGTAVEQSRAEPRKQSEHRVSPLVVLRLAVAVPHQNPR